jgi:putative hydrolase of the HAD superfamily
MTTDRPPDPRRYAAIVFDLFGTLIDFDPARLPTLLLPEGPVPSTIPAFAPLLHDVLPAVPPPAFARALRATSEALRAETRASLVETSSRERFRRTLAGFGCAGDRLDEAAVVLSRAHHAAIGAATVFPAAHAATLAAAARSGPVGLVSNFDDTASAFAILARHGILESLATVVVSEAVGFRKPHPALLAAALTTLGVAPGETLFVGDSFEADVGVAHALGADAAWIDAAGTGVPRGARAPRHVVPHLAALVGLLGSDAPGRRAGRGTL